MSIMLLPITSITYGRTFSKAAEGPAMAKISFPAAAIGLAPNTGEEMKKAPALARRSEHLATVSG